MKKGKKKTNTGAKRQASTATSFRSLMGAPVTGPHAPPPTYKPKRQMGRGR